MTALGALPRASVSPVASVHQPEDPLWPLVVLWSLRAARYRLCPRERLLRQHSGHLWRGSGPRASSTDWELANSRMSGPLPDLLSGNRPFMKVPRCALTVRSYTVGHCPPTARWGPDLSATLLSLPGRPAEWFSPAAYTGGFSCIFTNGQLCPPLTAPYENRRPNPVGQACGSSTSSPRNSQKVPVTYAQPPSYSPSAQDHGSCSSHPGRGLSTPSSVNVH